MNERWEKGKDKRKYKNVEKSTSLNLLEMLCETQERVW